MSQALTTKSTAISEVSLSKFLLRQHALRYLHPKCVKVAKSIF